MNGGKHVHTEGQEAEMNGEKGSNFKSETAVRITKMAK